MSPPDILQLAAIIFGPTGGAFVGAKVAFNGIYKRLDRHEEKLDKLTEGQSVNRERLARLEGSSHE